MMEDRNREKASIRRLLVSHQVLSFYTMRAGGYYQKLIIVIDDCGRMIIAHYPLTLLFLLDACCAIDMQTPYN